MSSRSACNLTDWPCFKSFKSSKFKFKYLVKWPDYSSSYMELLFLTADICVRSFPSQNNNPYLYVDCLHLTFKTLEIFWFRWYINWIKITISYTYSFNFWLKTITSLSHICSEMIGCMLISEWQSFLIKYLKIQLFILCKKRTVLSRFTGLREHSSSQ